LEGDPEIGREVSPYDFVQDREKKEKQAPAQRQLLPACRVEMEGRIEDVAEQRLPEGQPAEQDDAEQRVDDGGLHLDELVVLQIERQRAEDEDDDAGYQWHDRQRTHQDP